MPTAIPSDRPRLPLACYVFRYRADEDIRLQTDPRGLWHGVFGLRLRELACLLPGTECPGCLLLHQCPYSYLFSGPRPPDAEIMRRYATIPVPHVFRLDCAWPASIRAGDTLPVSMVLIGGANERLPLVIQAMAAAGEGGLGPKRGQVWLQDVEQHLPGDEAPRLVAAKGRILDPRPPVAPRTPPVPQVAHLRFRTPYKASGQGAPGDGLEVGRLFMAVVRRISLLQYFYTGRRLEAPFDVLKAASERAQIVDHDLRRHSAARYAPRHGHRVDTSGLVGRLDLAMTDCEALWPYLHLGQWLNVGKNASMGFGHYTLSPMGQDPLGAWVPAPR